MQQGLLTLLEQVGDDTVPPHLIPFVVGKTRALPPIGITGTAMAEWVKAQTPTPEPTPTPTTGSPSPRARPVAEVRLLFSREDTGTVSFRVSRQVDIERTWEIDDDLLREILDEVNWTLTDHRRVKGDLAAAILAAERSHSDEDESPGDWCDSDGDTFSYEVDGNVDFGHEEYSSHDIPDEVLTSIGNSQLFIDYCRSQGWVNNPLTHEDLPPEGEE